MAEITTEPNIVDGEGVTLDLILWRRFRMRVPGTLEQLLALPENQHLERTLAELPPETIVRVPANAPQQSGTFPVVSLWS